VEFSSTLISDTNATPTAFGDSAEAADSLVLTFSNEPLPYADGIRSYTFQTTLSDGTLIPTAAQGGAFQITAPADMDALVAAINANQYMSGSTVTATNSSGTLVLTSTGTTLEATAAGHNPLTVLQNVVVEKSSSQSGREGAGAELLEMVTAVDQTASRGDLQLRLDTLGISDSAFGEFSVDTTGLITMKQDGADFAIGQIAIATFNNNRGLNPSGNNLLQKTNESGEAIYNLNNAKAATVEGGTLELSEADLSESLVNLMVFQRAFEANAKSITSADELLNTLINLKR